MARWQAAVTIITLAGIKSFIEFVIYIPPMIHIYDILIMDYIFLVLLWFKFSIS